MGTEATPAARGSAPDDAVAGTTARGGAAPSTQVLEARTEAATALRRLGHALVGHEVDPATLQRITRLVEDVLPVVEAGAGRSRPVDDMKRQLFDEAPGDGEALEHFPDCVVSGLANPMGVAITVRRDGDDAVARVTLGAAFEGAPGRAHGGIVAAVFDDTMGFVLSMERSPAFTGSLTVTYHAPTPIGEELEFRCRLRERVDRKLWMEGEATAGGATIVTAEGLFIAIPPERFGVQG
jgi:acyl-coenzyme A thioesterase PaaI-like protein